MSCFIEERTSNIRRNNWLDILSIGIYHERKVREVELKVQGDWIRDI